MKELPKELTHSLLGLVLHPETVLTNKEKYPLIIEHNELKLFVLGEVGEAKPLAINIDTLTRLILEYIERQGYIYNIFNSTSVQGYVMIIDARKYIGKSIFEVSLKHIDFISKL